MPFSLKLMPSLVHSRKPNRVSWTSTSLPPMRTMLRRRYKLGLGSSHHNFGFSHFSLTERVLDAPAARVKARGAKVFSTTPVLSLTASRTTSPVALCDDGLVNVTSVVRVFFATEGWMKTSEV